MIEVAADAIVVAAEARAMTIVPKSDGEPEMHSAEEDMAEEEAAARCC